MNYDLEEAIKYVSCEPSARSYKELAKAIREEIVKQLEQLAAEGVR